MATLTWHACKYQYMNPTRGASSNALHSGRGLRLTHCIHDLLSIVCASVLFCFGLMSTTPRLVDWLQALVYDILPSTTAVFSYAIGPRQLSANEQFFCWCSNSSKVVTNNSDYIRRLFYNWPCCLRQLKWNQNRLKRGWTLLLFSFFLFSFFYPGWMRLMFMCVLGR